MKKLVANCFDPRFSLYRAQISARNAAQLQVFAAVGTTLAALFALMELVLSEAARFFTTGLFILVYFCLLLAVNALALRRETRFATLLCYAEQMPLMLTAILMGTFWDPTRSSITILLFLCVLPMLILDTPWHVNLYSTGIAAFSVSVGCVLFPEGRCVSYEDVYRRADTCLYRAKGAGRDCYVLE